MKVEFIDIDHKTILPTDYDSERVPNKGDVIHFSTYVDNISTNYYCVVLYVCDERRGYKRKDMPVSKNPISFIDIISREITVITREINPTLGRFDETKWTSIEKLINRENNLNQLVD